MIVNINRLPKSVFVPAVRRRDIVQAMLISSNNKITDRQNLAVTSIIGERYHINRRELILKYKHLNNCDVKLFTWRKNKSYFLYRMDNTKAFTFYVPKNMQVDINMNGKNMRVSESYIVTFANLDEVAIDNGVIFYVVKAKTFRKVFKLLPNEIINRYKGVPKQTNSIKTNTTQVQPVVIAKKEDDYDFGDSDINSYRDNKPANNDIQIQNKVTIKQVTKLRITGKLADGTGQMIGYVVSNGKNSKKLTANEVLYLCKNGNIQNAMAVEKDGKWFIRGNGIRLDSLPVITIN